MKAKHILVADDEKHTRAALTFILENAGYAVTSAQDGVSALAAIAQFNATDQPVDLLVTDIQMPGMNGLELLEELQRRQVHIPVVAMTGYGDKETILALLERGCAGYLDKPIEPDDVLKQVRGVVTDSEERGGAGVDGRISHFAPPSH